MTQIWRGVAGWSLSVLLIAGCASAPPQSHLRPARLTEYGKVAGLTQAQQLTVAATCPEGKPDKTTPADFGNTTLIVRKGYVLEHSATEKIPLWVCERVTKAAVSGPLGRPKPEPFAPDPDLKGQSRAELSDYKGSGYDRGHQEPSADQTVNQTLQDETYYLSNMAPQWPNLNQRIWKSLEEHIRDVATKHGDVFVITGPMFYDPAEDNPQTADGYVEYQTIGTGVAVPTHCYKVIVWKDDAGKWQGVGIVIENRKAAYKSPYHFQEFAKPIKWIEAETGLNFMPQLSGVDALRVEGKSNGAANKVPWSEN